MYEKYEVATISLVTRHPVKELLISEMAISPADNPVGALFERYQTSGAPMPEIEVPLIISKFLTEQIFHLRKIVCSCCP